MARLFLFLIAASVVPVCMPLLRRGPLPQQYWKAVVAVAFSACLQTLFVIAVARNGLTLDYSLPFAIFGIPACVLAIGRDDQPLNRVGCLGNSSYFALVGVVSPSARK